MERERERERCTLADEVWEVLLTGKIQGMDSLELYDKSDNLPSNTRVKWHKRHPKFSCTILGFWFQVPSMVDKFCSAVLTT